MTVLVAWGWHTLERSLTQLVLANLEGITRAKTSAISQFLQDRRSEVERICGLLAPQVVEVERRLRPTVGDLPQLPTPSACRRPVRALQPPTIRCERSRCGRRRQRRGQTQSPSCADSLSMMLWDQRRYEELMVIDPEGKVIASTHQSHEGHAAESSSYYKGGLGATVLEPVFVSPITEKLTTVVATPVRDTQAGVVGVLVARLNLARFYQLVGDATGLGETGETVLGRKVGDAVELIAPTRHDPDAALKRKIPLGAARSAGSRVRCVARAAATSSRTIVARPFSPPGSRSRTSTGAWW